MVDVVVDPGALSPPGDPSRGLLRWVAMTEEDSRRHPLAEADAAFEVGDYRRVRELCRDLTGADDPTVRQRADDLMRRTGIDPVQVAVVLGCLAFFVAVIYLFILS